MKLTERFRDWLKSFDDLRFELFGAGALVPALSMGSEAAGYGAEGGPLVLFSASDDDERRIRAGRRRPSKTEPEERERAEAPERKRPSAGRPPTSTARPATPPRPSSTPRPSSSPRPSGTGGKPLPLPSLGSLAGAVGGLKINPMIIVGVIIFVLICCVPLFLIFGGGSLLSGITDPGTDQQGVGAVVTAVTPAIEEAGPEFEQPAATAVAAPTLPSINFAPPSTTTQGQSWLIMLYQDADDKILEHDILLDLNEAEKVGSSDRVFIVSQIDRYAGGYDGDGNWTSTRRYLLNQDDDLNRINSPLLADLGELNMADGQTLVDFVSWAVANYPADKYVLIMADHGMGWPGGWSDPAPGAAGDRSIPLASAIGDQLYLMEIDEALTQIREQTGIGYFELIGMDACLMGHLEVFSALAPHAHYAVASQETEPALGWAYTSFLGALTANPDMSGAELAEAIVNSYVSEDQRVVDNQARAEFLRQGSPLGGLFSLLGGGGGGTMSAEQLAHQLQQDITITAMDLSQIPSLLDSVNNLALALQGGGQKAVAGARNYAPSFTSIFGSNVPPSYIDLGSFVQLLMREGNGDWQFAGNQVLAAIDGAVVAERHGPNKQGATGVSIYFPNSQLYGSPVTGPQSYVAMAERFADVSLWDDYLAYHYTGRGFQPTDQIIVVPDSSVPVVAPGGGDVTISAITASGDTAAPGEPVLLSANVSGEDIGYIYFFTGFYDQQANSIFVADNDYLESGQTREIDGHYYPDWGDGSPFVLEFEWEPLMFAISDGTETVLAALSPQDYGKTAEDAVYTVDGIYTYASGESRSARLYFRDGLLRQVFGFTGDGTTGAPREIIPTEGDRFTVLEKWFDLDANGRVTAVTTQDGGSLTFGSQMFTWEELDAAPGVYIVGFIVEDLDGNQYEVYTQIMVE
jgi:hypothetical protein